MFIKLKLRDEWMRKNMHFALLIKTYFTNVVTRQVNTFFGNFYVENITAKHRTAKKMWNFKT